MDTRNARESYLPDGIQKLEAAKPSKNFFGNIIRRDTKLSSFETSDSAKGNYGLTTLYNPSSKDPVADLVFVHGLNGGSQSTWTKGDESNFWPRAWLPQDDAFKATRIHTFGYHSGISKESVLNIQDFARSFLGAINDAPSIPRGTKVGRINHDQTSQRC